jgi:hypothetical protein
VSIPVGVLQEARGYGHFHFQTENLGEHPERAGKGRTATLPDLAANAQMRLPTLIIVGEVVKLQDKLAWFKPEPIVGGSDFVQTSSD